MAQQAVARLKIGLISDTHGVLRPEALGALRGVDRIVHGGDIGGPQILEALRGLAPLEVVRGNNDRAPWARNLPLELTFDAAGIRVHVLHNLGELNLDPQAAGIRVVVAGHSHRPGVTQRSGVLYVNPGSAGPRRFNLPVCVGYLDIEAGTVTASIRKLV